MGAGAIEENLPAMLDRPTEWARLTEALESAGPTPCTNDRRFTAEPKTLTRDALRTLGDLCASCPALDACDTYAAASRPPAGFWAGRLYPIRKETT